MRRPLPWHGFLIERVFHAGPTYSLEKIAAGLKQTEKACAKVLASEWGQAELARYQSARRQVLAQRGVQPLEELKTYAYEAVRALYASMWMAAEHGNARELRESARAVLDYSGFAPVKRVEKQVLHQIETITDPAVLARIINDEDVDLAALPAPETQQ